MKLQEWYEEKRKQIEATGWRRHGALVGDKVKLHASWDWHEDEFYEVIDGKERAAELLIEDGAIGKVIELLEGDRVKAEFECLIWYWRKDKKTKEHKRHEFTDTHILQLDIVPSADVDTDSTAVDPVLTLVKSPQRTKPKQLKLFEVQP